MAKRKPSEGAKPDRSEKHKSDFLCLDCGFVAKHAMGLGRHRTSQHGVPSQRQRRLASQPVFRRPEADIKADLERIERKLDQLLERANSGTGPLKARRWGLRRGPSR